MKDLERIIRGIARGNLRRVCEHHAVQQERRQLGDWVTPFVSPHAANLHKRVRVPTSPDHFGSEAARPVAGAPAINLFDRKCTAGEAFQKAGNETLIVGTDLVTKIG